MENLEKPQRSVFDFLRREKNNEKGTEPTESGSDVKGNPGAAIEPDKKIKQAEPPVPELEVQMPEPSLEKASSQNDDGLDVIQEIHALSHDILDFKDLIIKAVREESHKTDAAVDRLSSLIEEKDTQIEKQSDTIRRQSQTISRFQDDLLYKVQKPLIMEIIEIADNVRLILEDKELVEKKDFDQLYESVKRLYDWVNAALSNNSVREFRMLGGQSTEFDRKRQEVVDVEYTDDPSKDSVYYSERPGYVWSMPYLIINSEIQLKNALEDAPKTFEFVIRPEEIVKLKYKKTEE